jgi:uncharacterized protein YjdB
MKKIYTLLVLSLLSFAVKAQITATSYTFSQSSGTYVPLDSATEIFSGSYWDDDYMTDIPIGFTFNYMGTGQTLANVHANGYIDFGSYGSIYGFYNDLYFISSPISYKTTGTAPNRVFTVEWKDFCHYATASSGPLNFQIKLYEGTNAIKVVYGTFAATSASEYNNTVGIGSSTDGNFRATTTSWSATVPDTLGTGCVQSDIFFPPSGLTFAWTPPTTSSSTPSTFVYTGSVQTYTVPAGVTSVLVDAQGGKGGNNNNYPTGSYPSRGGYGGKVVCTLAVTPGQILNVYVGGAGGNGTTSGGTGGFNGGGNGASSSPYAGGAGGGASDIRFSPYALADRKVVAGGGGGAGLAYPILDNEKGGAGGGLTGENGYSNGTTTSTNSGRGGTQSAGGANGDGSGTSGTLGAGGNAISSSAGGGGGGYYGGGSGGGSYWAGAGGGSSFTASSITSGVVHTQGYNTTGDGIVMITPISTAPCSGTPTAGTASVSPTSGNTGTAFTLIAPGATVDSGITFQWQSSPDSTTWANISGATTSSYSFTGISATTYYRCNVTCAVSGITSATAGVKTTYIVTYCTPTFSAASSACTTYGLTGRISSLTGYSGSISDAVACNSTGYYDRTALSCTLARGSSYSASIVTGNVDMSCQLWIDFNNDGTFQSTESVGGVTAFSSSTPGIATITIPTSVSTGTFRMRLVSNYTACCGGLVYPSIPSCPSGSISYGESRDYTVSIISSCSDPAAIIGGSTSFCAGTTTTLMDTTFGGTWSSGNTSVATVDSSGVVTGVYGGTARITYMVAGGCVATKVVTVTPAANAGIVVGTAHVATGGTTTLSDRHLVVTSPSSIAGDLSISASNYGDGTTGSWGAVPYTFTNMAVKKAPSSDTLGCGTFTSGYFSGKVALIWRGTCEFGYKALQAQNAGASAVIIVNNTTAAPGAMGIGSYGSAVTIPVFMTSLANGTAIANRLNEGDTVMVSVTTASGGTWSSDNTAKATVNSAGVVTGVDTGNTVINYTVSNSCGSSTAISFMDIHVPVNITGTTSICLGTTSSLAGAPTGGVWSSSNTSIATVDTATGLMAGVGVGTATITYYISSTLFTTATVTVNSAPGTFTGTFVVDSGATVTLSNSATFGVWSSSNTSVATIGSATGVMTGITPGSATITYTIGSCFATTPIIVYSSSSLPAAACTPTYIYPVEACSSLGINISNFQVAGFMGSTLTDASSCGGTGYESRTGLAVTMEQNGTYVATLSASGGYYSNVQVWIDFNNNGAFDSSETVGGKNYSYPTSDTFHLRIPFLANPGLHRMRVLTTYSSTGYFYPNLNPCASSIYYYGDTRDYTANINALPPCSGAPAVSIASSTSGACATTPAVLTASGFAYTSGVSFQWQSSSDSTSWANISGATNTTYVAAISAHTYFRCAISCSYSGSTTYSNILWILYSSGCVCTPTYYYSSTAGSYQMINFSLAGESGSTINDNGPLVIPPSGYEDRTSIPIYLQQNGTYSGSQTYTHNYQYYTNQVWIDFNDNGTFEDSETVTPIYGHSCSVSSASTSFSLHVPHTANTGYHRMRVRQAMTWSCSLPSVMNPCGYSDAVNAYYYGMARDYTAYISPMPSCSGTPYAGTAVTNGSTVACSTSTYTLSMSGATLASNLTYQWQSSPDSTTWSNISGGTTETFTTSETATTYYRCILTCAPSGLSDTSGLVKVLYTSGCICTPSYYYGSTAGSYQMANFSLSGYSGSTINDDGPTPIPSVGYANRTSISINLQQGGSYSGTETYTHNYIYYVTQIWIDYNDNGTFEPSEIVTPVFGLDCSVYTSSTGFTLNVLPTATVGTHVMRVRQAMTYNCATAPVMDPCSYSDGTSVYYYGMTRDYSVNIQPCSSAPTVSAIAGTASMCQGTTSTLSVMPVGGTWSSSDGSIASVGSTGIVTGTSAGTATISYTITNTCGTTHATRIATINPLPNAGAITGSDSIAVGTTITLSDTATGGSWSSSNPTVATIGTSGVITPIVAGTSYITYTVTNGCGTAYATKMITVTSPAALYCVPSYYYGAAANTYQMVNFSLSGHSGSNINDNGPATVLDGGYQDRTFISVDLVQGGAYTGSETYTHNYYYYINQVWVDFNDNGTYENSEIVTPVYGGGDCSTPSSGTSFTMNIPATANTGTHLMRVRQGMTYNCGMPVFMNPCSYSDGAYAYYYGMTRDYSVNILGCTTTPTVGSITGTASLCQGTTTSLYAMPVWGTWSSSDAAVGTVSTSGVVSGISGGTTTVSYTVTNSCGTAVATKIVTVNPLPIAGVITGPDSIAVGSTVTFSDTASGGTWSSSNTLVAPVGSTGIVNAVLFGSTTLSYTKTNSCGTSYATKNVTVTSLASVYCVPSYYYGAPAGTYQMVNFTLNGDSSSVINDNGPTTVPSGGYEDRTFISINLKPGNTYSGSETYTHAHTNYTNQIWIDFNDNGGFENSEAVTNVYGPSCGFSISSSSFNLTIPPTANTGAHLMRVRQAEASSCALAAIMNPCSYYDATNTYYYGMTRDYTVNIVPLPACSGTPTAGFATATPSIACSTTVVTLTLSGATYASGLSFQWQESSSGTTWSNISGATTYPYNVTGISANTYYRCLVSCGGSTATSGVIMVTGTPCYCTPAYYYAADACSYYGMNISRFVAVGEAGTSINDSLACSGTGYEARLGLSATYLANTAYSANIKCSGGYSMNVQTWIDFNNDGVFASSESVGGYNGFGSGGASYSLVIPSGVSSGARRMRVVTSYYYNSYPSMDPCTYGYNYGDARDYMVNIVTSSICSGTPVPGTVDASVTTGCVNYSSTLSLADTSLASVSGLTFQWQSASDTSSWTNVSGATTVSYTASVTATVYYRCVITCTNSGLSANTPAKMLQKNAIPAISGTTTVCNDYSWYLTGTPSGGAWATGDSSIAIINTSTGLAHSLSAGTVSITYTLSSLGAGCVGTTTVTVQALPTVFTVTGGGSYCAGTGGVHVGLSGSSTGVMYQLYRSSSPVGVPLAGTGGALGFGLQTVNGSYYVVATNTTTGCTNSMGGSVTVTAEALPAITGTTNVCQGSVTTLSHSTGGGTWSSSNTAVATVGTTTGAVTGVTAGSAVITYTAAPGCIATTVVTVNPIPTSITGPTTVCLGASIILSSTTTGGTWTGSSSNVSVGYTSGSVTGVTVGTATVSYTIGSCFRTATVTVNPLPPAISGAGNVCVSQTITLSDSVSGGAWSSGNTSKATVNATTGVVTGVSSGTVNISYTLPSGCYIIKVVTVNPLPATVTGTQQVCIGMTTNLSNATPSGVWSTAHPSIATVDAGGTVTGVTAGTATISYTLSTGCTALAFVTVNSLPSAISGTAVVCEGSTTALAVSPSGGTWSSGATSIAVVGSTGVVTGIAAGLANITYTLGTGCYNSVSVTVNPLPSPISGVANICVGATSSLTNTSPGGAWSSSNTTVASIGSSTGVVTGLSGGTSKITYTLPTGCFITKNITISPLPAAIAGSMAVCVGSNTTLTNSTSGGAWSSGSTSVATVGTGGAVTGVSAGTAVITYSLSTGCNATAIVTVNALPDSIAGATSLCVGATATLTNTVTGGTWASSNPTVANIISSTGVVTGMASGTSRITYTIGTGCKITRIITVNPNPAAIGGTAIMCAGSSVTLTNSTTGGTWSSSNTTVANASGTLGVTTGVSAGTAVITYTAPTGCYATKVVTVNPLPVAITGASSICVGQSTTLTDSTSGGTWASSTPSVASINSSTGVLSGASAGTATITYALGSGCKVTKVITVNPLPSTITGSTSVCVGVTTTYTNTVSGGTWASSNTTVATVGTAGDITGVAPGTAVITYSLGTGCMKTKIISVNPLPGTISGTASACIGTTTTLANTPTGGTWSSGTPSVATIGLTNGVVSGVSAGTSLITYRLSTGCVSTRIVTINTLTTPITGTAVLCAGATSTLANATTGGTWSSSTASIATVGSASGILTGVNAGTATITYTAGCKTTTVVTINALPAAITGTATACVGSTTALSSTTTGGVWSSSNTTVATIDGAGLVTALSTGTSVISYTLSTGCARTRIVTINAGPATIGGTMSVCVGAATTLSNTTGGGTWASNTTSVATIGMSSGIVNGISAGTAVITYLAGGCSTTSVVTVNPLPAAITGTASVCVGGITSLSNATTGGTWNSGNTAVATVDVDGVVTGVASGTAAITYALSTGCRVTAIVTVNPMSPITGTAAMCEDGNTTLSNATTGGTWISGNTAVATIGSLNGVVSGLTAGTSVITYATASGCSTTMIVTVNALPAAITGTGTMCAGNSTTLSSATTGGTWSSNNTAVATADTDGVVTGVIAGTATIKYTLGTSCFITTVVTVNALPQPITGTLSACVGNTTNLASATTGGVWSSGAPSIAAIGTAGTVTGIADGTAGITYTSGAGCETTAVVTINPLPTAITGTFVMCIGASTTLVDTTAGGTWVSGTTTVANINSSTGVVTGMGAGTSIITYILPTGCRATAIVTVNPAPTAIMGTATMCEGASVTLSDATTGGVWSSGNTSVATVGSADGIVNGIAAGTASITYTLGTGCLTTKTVTVNPLPSAILGTLTVCAGSSTSLSDTTASPVSWTSSNTSVATINSGTAVATGISAGTATITYTVGSGCYTTAVLTVNGLPAISGTASVCEGLTTTLAGTPSGGTWLSSTTSVATVGTDGVVSGISAGNANIYYTAPGTGCVRGIVVTVNPAPAAVTGSASVCVGASTVLTSSTIGGTWSSSSSGIAIVGSTTAYTSVTGVTAGTSVITYTLPGGCYTTTIVTVNELSTAIGGITTVCPGTSASLTNATAGGTWSSASPTVASIDATSGVATGVNPGTAIITYTAGCSITAVITVNPLPAVITGTPAMCEGATTDLSDATSGGAWSSDNTSVATVDGTTGVVTGVAAGTATIYYTIGTGCFRSVVVTVNPMPSAITGATSVCVGTTATLASTPTGGTWTSSLTTVATIGASNGILNGIAAGATNITYTLGAGCLVTTTITVNPLPGNITGTLGICAGASTSLSSTTSGGVWSCTDVGVATIDPSSGIAIGVGTGTTVISYTLGTGCYKTAILTVNALPAAISGVSTMCSGTAATFTNSTSGGTWSSSNPSIASVNASTGVVSAVAGGNATITYTMGTGCITTAALTVQAAPAAIGGPKTLCVGSATTLTNTVSGGTWSGSSSTIATIDGTTGVVTGIAPGTAEITYSTSGSCSVTAVVTVNAAPSISGTLTICVSLSSTLSGSPIGGTWSSASPIVTVNSSNGAVTAGTTTGTAVITYNLSSGCKATAVVTVSTAPTAITGAASVCKDATTTFANTVSGGTWSSNNTTAATIDPATGVITGVTAGLSSVISYSLGGSCWKVKAISVNAIPVAITGYQTACVGLTTQFADATIGGAWSSSDTFTAKVNASNGIITGVAAGTAQITYTKSGCGVSRIVTVIASPGTITGATLMCATLQTTLSNAVPGGTWSSSNTAIATVGSGTGVVTAGTFANVATISYNFGANCRATKVVTVKTTPNVISGPTTLCLSGTSVYTCTSTGGTWSSSNSSASIVSGSATTMASIMGNSTGAVTISYTNAPGCTRTLAVTVSSCSRAANTTTTGIAETDGMDVAVYPNPTSSKFSLHAPENGEFFIYSLDGKEIAKYNITERNTAISMPETLATGVYMCRFSGNSGTSVMIRLVYEP